MLLPTGTELRVGSQEGYTICGCIYWGSSVDRWDYYILSPGGTVKEVPASLVGKGQWYEPIHA